MGRKLLPCLDAVYEGIDLVLEHVSRLEFRHIVDQSAVFRGIQGEILTVAQTDTALVAHEINVALLFPNVLSVMTGPEVRTIPVTESSTSYTPS